MGTLVERRSGYVVLLHLPDGHNSAAVRDALLAGLVALPDTIRKTLISMPSPHGSSAALRPLVCVGIAPGRSSGSGRRLGAKTRIS